MSPISTSTEHDNENAYRCTDRGDPDRRAVSIRSATAGTNDGYFGQLKQGCNITYMGFPLCDWYRPDLP